MQKLFQNNTVINHVNCCVLLFPEISHTVDCIFLLTGNMGIVIKIPTKEFTWT